MAINELTTMDGMIRVKFDLLNNRVWKRVAGGGFIPCQEIMDWLDGQGLHARHSREGIAIQDAAGYSGYRYSSVEPFKVISGTYAFGQKYGDIRLGPDAHLYNSFDELNGPIMGYYWFDEAQRDIALLMKLTWG